MSFSVKQLLKLSNVYKPRHCSDIFIKYSVASVTRNLDTLFAVSREEATTEYPGLRVLLLQISELFEERGKPKTLRSVTLVTSWKSQRVLRLFH